MYLNPNPTYIIEIIKLIEEQQFFTYYTVNDEAVCNKCDNYDEGSMTRTEIIGTFPYLIKYTPTMWLPMVHPNCRCVLIFEETDEMPRPNKLSTDQLIDKVKDEMVTKKQDLLSDNQKKLAKDEQFGSIRQKIEQKYEDAKTKKSALSPEDIADDEDIWDLAALGVLDTLYKRKKREVE